MPLRLVTGPANAEKARRVLDLHAAASAAGREPLLVVPTLADVERYRREVAQRGVVFGAQVLTMGDLERELARRAGVRGRVLRGLARERVAALAISRARLQVLGASAGSPGFLSAWIRFCDELGALRVAPARWWVALRRWSAAEPARAAYAEDLGALYATYHRGLDALGRRDAVGHAIAALDVLRVEPARWGAAPVLLYGFDDLTALQRDVVETLATRVGAEVTVSLPYERGREALAGRAGVFAELRALGAEVEELAPHAEHYAQPALHALERGLFEPGGARIDDDAAAAAAVGLLRGGGERAEAELVGAHVARLLRDGVRPGEIAIAVRHPDAIAPLLERVLGAYGIPFALERSVPASHTALGRGLLALLRCALLDGGADELLTFLRTPGFLARPGLADALERTVRREGLRTAIEARAAWERDGRFPLLELDRLVEAHARGPAALCRRLAGEAARLFAAPHLGRAPVLDAAGTTEARVAAQLRTALEELSALADADRALMPGPQELHRVLGALAVRIGRRPGPDAVTVADPLAVRARRVRALFVCALQEGAFPAPPRPEPFLGDAERRALNAASGLRLGLNEDAVGAERALFYAAVSRPTDRLVLSWHAADEDGDPQVRSGFVDDVLDLLPNGFAATHTERRELGAAGFADVTLAPTAREAARAVATLAEAAQDERIAALSDPVVLGGLRAREAWSASALELWTACPVRWFVERHLRADELLPDPEPMVRGALAHQVLEDALQTHTGAAPQPLAPGDAAALRGLVQAALRRRAPAVRISANPDRVRAILRRLEADLVRYVEAAALAGSVYAPAHFELAFGPGTDREAVPLADGALTLAGRIDRVDVAPGGTALLYDYKGATAQGRGKWRAEGRLQLALYMLALGHLLDLRAIGGLYQPLGGREAQKPRGVIAAGEDPGLRCVATDRADPDELEALLDDALAAALRAVGELREGRLEARPATCGFAGGGCRYPSVCRAEGM